MTRGRFAPSPTGRMHLGNVYAALLSWLAAKSKGGEWVLRIEDIDPGRSRQEFADRIMDDLEWLGLTWDGEVTYQSQRQDIYEHYFDLLRKDGLLYPCFCSRADLLATQAPHESDGRVVYKGTCRNMSPAHYPQGITPAWRMRVPDETIETTDGHYGTYRVHLPTEIGDFIVRRKDGAFAYQLVVVVDDLMTGITEVVRGRDLLLSTPQQLFMARILRDLEKEEIFPQVNYIHFPLLINEAGQRLSKRDKSLNMGVLRKQHSAKDIIGKIAHLAGLTPTPAPIAPQDLLPAFSWDNIPVEDIIV
ncbi:MAG: tRNA glutamyl-Q(34) synthetase GluQRS [Prevotella sp.]|nr:tRNA glutamyl-Q(34) synthetase GluQRS [Prevotella sp.]